MNELVAIVGDGQMGLVLADALAERGVAVRLWGPFEEDIADLARTRRSPRRLADFTLSETVEVTAEAEERYTSMIHSEMERTVWKSGGCTSWYQSKSGHVIAMFPGFSFTYRHMAKAFKAGDHMFGSAAASAPAELEPDSAQAA